MYITAGLTELCMLPYLIDVQNNDLRRAIGERLAHYPIGCGNREIVVGHIIRCNAVILPQLHGIDCAEGVAVSEEQHIDLFGVLDKGRNLFTASFVFQDAAGSGKEYDQCCEE